MPNGGPHRKRIKHYHEPGNFHELTFSCYHRMPLLTNDDWRQRLSRKIQSACDELSLDLVAFVFMPEHIHLLVFPTQPTLDLAALDLGRFSDLPLVAGVPLGTFDKGQPR
jgi:REP-associated tyrosine transposase